MSGWIRAKELPTRYEVRIKNMAEHFNVKEHALEELGRRLGWGQQARLVTIRRWQMERTEVTEERYEYTCWTTPTLKTVIEVVLRKSDRWHVEPQDSCDDSVHMSREEAEAAARKWLHGNGYRLKRAA